MNDVKPTNPLTYNYEKLKKIKPTMTFSTDGDFDTQKSAISMQLQKLVSMPSPLAKCEPILVEKITDDDRFDEARIIFESEPGFFVPAHLIYPKNTTEKIPLVICLQGHTPGMHISLGREPYPSRKPIPIQGDRDFCIQAVERGYAALALEQRGFGELSCYENGKKSCHELTWQAALAGKTLLGQRLYDISNAITAVTSYFSFVDASRIGVMGNSGGGTSSYFAACFDERIKVSMPSSAFCTIVDSWGQSNHCDCGYIHGILNYFEMADVSIMIAPRYLIAVNGIYDHIQPFASAEREFERVKVIFEKAGVKDHCRLVAGLEGHRFYASLAWDVFDDFINR